MKNALQFEFKFESPLGYMEQFFKVAFTPE